MAPDIINNHASKAGIVVVLSLGLFVGGCQSSAPKTTPAPLEVESRQHTPPAAKARPGPEVARAALEPERIYPDPESLKGISANGVVGTIGKPEFIRKDQPAEIWQYRGTACTLDIFLYQSVTGAPYKVEYIETRAQTNGPTSNKDCLASILKERDAAETVKSTS